MSEMINFDGVEAAASKPYTRPGTIGIFKISDVKFESSTKKGTPYMKVFFDRQEDAFNHSFMLRGSTDDKTKKVLSRIQYLLTVIHGEAGKLVGKITPEAIKMKLVGKELALKVIGEVSSEGKAFAALSFGGFAAKPEEIQFLAFSKEEQRLVDAALEALEAGRSGRADSEGGEGTYTDAGSYDGGNTMEEPTPETSSEKF